MKTPMTKLIAAALCAVGLSSFAAEPEAVQLWEDGPYWAECNIGAELYTFNNNKAADAAKTLGGDWRLPTKDELEKLANASYCTKKWDSVNKGYTFTGATEGYKDKSIFLPAAGYDYGGGRDYAGDKGRYWSSEECDVYRAWMLSIFEGEAGVYANDRSNGLSVRAVRDTPLVTGPTCVGGEIAEGEGGEWIVAPSEGVTEVAVTGLTEGDSVAVPPTVTKVNGVGDAQIKVRSGAYDITGAFTVSGGAITLNENGSVTIADETIPVKPTIGDLGDDAGEPFTVGEGSAAVTVRAIPGLKYELRRAEGIGSGGFIETALPVGEPVVATEATVTLTDGEPPKVKAFYKVVVSAP